MKAKPIQRALFEGFDHPARGGTIRDESALGGLFDASEAVKVQTAPITLSLDAVYASTATPYRGNGEATTVRDEIGPVWK
jgi:hypothetical protein